MGEKQIKRSSPSCSRRERTQFCFRKPQHYGAMVGTEKPSLQYAPMDRNNLFRPCGDCPVYPSEAIAIGLVPAAQHLLPVDCEYPAGRARELARTLGKAWPTTSTDVTHGSSVSLANWRSILAQPSKEALGSSPASIPILLSVTRLQRCTPRRMAVPRDLGACPAPSRHFCLLCSL